MVAHLLDVSAYGEPVPPGLPTGRGGPTAHTGKWFAWLDGWDTAHVDGISSATLKFTGTEDMTNHTSFVIDDVSLNAS